MPNSVRVGASVDLRGLVEDLHSVDLGLGREVSLAVVAAAETVAVAVPQFTPFDPDHRETRADRLPHLRETFTARRAGETVASIGSDHPGAPVHEFGGSIRPKGTRIYIKQSAMALKAGELKAAEFEVLVAARVEQLLARHGL